MDHLRHMSIFIEIVDAGSISAAADRLNLSKSVVSHHLKSLETAVGVQLLHRTTRRQQLTPAGKDFYQRCKQMADISALAWREARDTGDKLAGPIRISAPHALMDTIIAPAIARLCADNPLIKPSIEVQDQRVDLLSDDIDLVFRVGKLASSNLIQRQVGEFRDVVCASPSYLKNNAVEINNQHWPALDYIANSWQRGKIVHQLTAISADKQHPEQRNLEFTASRFTDNSSAVCALAKAGLGIALLPEFVFKQAQHHRHLAPLFADYHCANNKVYAVHDFGRTPPLLIKQTITFIKQQFSQSLAINP